MTTALIEWFTQTDPRPLGAGNAYEASYVYGGNRPTVTVDPSGERGEVGGGGGGVETLAVISPVHQQEVLRKAYDDKSDSLTKLQTNDRDNYNWCRAVLTTSISRSRLCRAYLRATYFAVQHEGDAGTEGPKTNAMRHCVWCGLLTAQVGFGGARPFLLRHENQNQSEDHGPDAAKVSSWRDRSRKYVDHDGFAESAIDWNNNYVGKAIGESSDSYILFDSAVDSVVKKCKSALTSGGLDLRSLEA
jgi:hypothetical protein